MDCHFHYAFASIFNDWSPVLLLSKQKDSRLILTLYIGVLFLMLRKQGEINLLQKPLPVQIYTFWPHLTLVFAPSSSLLKLVIPSSHDVP